MAEVREHPLAPQAAHRVIADRRQAVGLGRAAAVGPDHRVHVPGRVGHNPAASKPLAHHSRQIGVHRPGQGFLARGAELHRRHVNHVGDIRQRAQLVPLKQIAEDQLDVVLGQLVPHLGRCMLVHADDPPLHAGRLAGPPGHASQGGTDLAGRPQDQQVAVDSGHRLHDAVGRLAEQLLELPDVADRVAGCGGLVTHGCTPFCLSRRERPPGRPWW